MVPLTWHVTVASHAPAAPPRLTAPSDGKTRVVVCYAGIQWIVQRRQGEQWHCDPSAAQRKDCCDAAVTTLVPRSPHCRTALATSWLRSPAWRRRRSDPA
jgi:hypothetical protein